MRGAVILMNKERVELRTSPSRARPRTGGAEGDGVGDLWQ